MSGILGDLEIPIQGVLDLIFEEHHLTTTITYRLYRGQTAAGEDDFEEFSIIAILACKRYRTAGVPKRLQAQSGRHNYIIREADLPDHVTVGALSANDRIVHGDSELLVLELDKTLGFVINIVTQGD
jgi:hypothetical protein